ncbi:MAG: glycosyltransferase [Chitinophagaceae bacterium]
MDGLRSSTTLKKILYISYDGMTDQLGQSQVIPYLAGLAELGYEFHVLSVEKKQRYAENNKKIRELLSASGIKWTTLFFSSRPPLLSKLYDQYRLNKAAEKICRSEKIDLVHCRSYVAAAAGRKASRKLKIPFLFDMRGFWVDERVDSGLWDLKKPLYRFIYKRYKKKEKNYLAESAHIISLTRKGKDELVSSYAVPEQKITVIPCCADLELFNYTRVSEDQKNSVREMLSLPAGTPVISYLGSLGGWYLTKEMLEFFRELRKELKNAVFLFITHDDKEKILALAASAGIGPDAIRVKPAARKEVPLLLSVSDWNIFFIKDAYSKKASSPTKQGEVMAMGIPVICNDIGDTGTIVNQFKSGIVVPSFTEQNYTAAINGLLKARFDRAAIREGAMQVYDLGLGVKKYSTVYSSILS